MKKKFTLIIFLLIAVFAFISTYSIAQSDDKTKAKVKVVIVHNGKTTVVKAHAEGSGNESNAIIKKLIIDDDGTKKLTVTTIKNGEKETIEMEGDEVDKYLEEHKDMQIGAKAKGRSMAGDSEEEVEINIDIDDILAKAGIHITTSEGGEKKVVVKCNKSGKGYSYNYQFNSDSCMMMFGEMEEGFKAMCKGFAEMGNFLEHMDIDVEVIEDDGNKKVIVKTIRKDGKEKIKVMIIKDSKVYEDVDDLEKLLEELHIDIDINLTDKIGKKTKTVIVRKIVTIEDVEEDFTSERKKGTNKALKVNKLNFFPNPNDGKFTLEFEATNNATIEITVTDVNGKNVFKKAVRGKGKYSQQIDISGESSGVYFLNLRQGKRTVTKKLLVE